MKLGFLSGCLVAIAVMISNVGVSNASSQPPLANAVIIIIRHAEKPDTGSGLTPAGQQRAQAYIQYFEHFEIDSKVRVPDYLIATKDSKNSERPRLTLTPLSKALNIPLDTRFKKTELSELATSLTSAPTGKTILICWHHENIPPMLQALGVDPQTLIPNSKWPEDVYNWVIVLHYDAKGNLIPAHSQRLIEHLLPGD